LVEEGNNDVMKNAKPRLASDKIQFFATNSLRDPYSLRDTPPRPVA
jgi:hypothetical protein